MTERVTSKPGAKPPARRGRKSADEPKRQARVRQVSEMLPEVGGPAFRRFGFVQSSVVSRWPEIVGPRYAGVSSPESIRFPAGKRAQGVLTLTVEGAHAAMLQHVAPVLIERVNRFFGYEAVARIQIRQGAALLRRKPAAPPPSLKPVPVELGDSLRAVGDPELRAVLESLAAGIASTSGPPILPEPSE
ncbi:MAG TPA: DciA family protein [Sphingomonas sp.]|nr:DciA family protein [Sphingomonas sp.]